MKKLIKKAHGFAIASILLLSGCTDTPMDNSIRELAIASCRIGVSISSKDVKSNIKHYVECRTRITKVLEK